MGSVMESIREVFRIGGNLLGAMKVMDFIDIAIVAFIIYKVLIFARKTTASALIKGIVLLIIMLWVSSEQVLHLTMINYLLGKALELGVIAIIVIFQPEIRNFLVSMGSSVTGVFAKKLNIEEIDRAVEHTVEACIAMSKTKTGALIVFERNIHLDEYVKSGTIMDCAPSVELFLQVFYPNTPLHDGAVIVTEGKIAAAGCMLPMSTNTNLSRELGMRHRAGIGITEHSDSVAVIVSEETGDISVAVGGMLKRRLTPETFEMLLRNELITEKAKIRERIRNKVKKNNV